MKDGILKGLIVALLVAITGLLAVILMRNDEPQHIYYESSPEASSELAAYSPSFEVDHQSIYWIADLAEQAMPFVVNIQTTINMEELEEQGTDRPRDLMEEFFDFGPDGQAQPFEYRERRSMPEGHPPVGGEGSGFVFREDGFIVTNAHVVQGADKFTVFLNDGTEYDAELIGSDNFKDIAVLKIDAENLPAATLGNSDSVRIGEPVVAIGSPVGFEGTVTSGIVSSNRRSVTDLGRQEDVRGTLYYIQTDAAINRGNSGGPLINAEGEVIGVNQAITRWDNRDSVPVEGIGFTIPINTIKESITDIVQNGKVVYPGISAQIASLEEFLRQNPKLILDVTEGVYISALTKGGPADLAGLEAGDVILDIDGAPVTSAAELIGEIQKSTVGDRVKLTVARQGGSKQEIVSVVLGELDLGGIPIGD